MSSFFDQIDRVVTRFINTVDDPAPGQPLASPSGAIIVGIDGQLGRKYAVGGLTAGAPSEASMLSSTTALGVFGGVYQYVQFKSGSTAANIRGGILFWSDINNFIVTPDVTLATQGLVAGIGLFANTKGNYGFIQIAGLASILMKSSITKGTPAAGDLIIVDQGGGTPTARGDILADATALTSLTRKSEIGVAYVDVPANATVGRVLLSTQRWTN